MGKSNVKLAIAWCGVQSSGSIHMKEAVLRSGTGESYVGAEKNGVYILYSEIISP